MHSNLATRVIDYGDEASTKLIPHRNCVASLSLPLPLSLSLSLTHTLSLLLTFGMLTRVTDFGSPIYIDVSKVGFVA